MIRLLLAIPCILFLATIGAFFLFVPPLLIAIVWIVTVALFSTGAAFVYCFAVRPELQLVPTVIRIDPKV